LLHKQNKLNMTNQTTELMEQLSEAINDLTTSTSDFTGWSLGESIDNLSLELRRFNDRADQK